MFFSTTHQSEHGLPEQTWLHACLGSHMETVPLCESQNPLDGMNLDCTDLQRPQECTT